MIIASVLGAVLAASLTGGSGVGVTVRPDFDPSVPKGGGPGVVIGASETATRGPDGSTRIWTWPEGSGNAASGSRSNGVGTSVDPGALPKNTTFGCRSQVAWEGGTMDDMCPIRVKRPVGGPGSVSAGSGQGEIEGEDGQGLEEWVPPKTEDIIAVAVGTAQLPGAGLRRQPAGPAYVGAPVALFATVTGHDVPVDLGDQVVHVRFDAVGYEFDPGDGGAAIVSNDPGAGYPTLTHTHAYGASANGLAVMLTTTWSATATNPYTGETLTVDSVLRTREYSEPFDVLTPVTAVTDDAERADGR